MARTVITLGDGIKAYDKESGDYLDTKEFVIEGKGQKWSTLMRSMQDKIFGYLTKMPTSDKAKQSEVEVKDEEEMTADTIIGIVSVSGNNADLYEAIMNSMKTYGSVNGTKCTNEMLDDLSEEDNDLIYRGFITDFLSKKVILEMKNMKK